MPRPFPLCPRSHPPRRRAPALLTAGLLLGLTPALATVAEADVIIKEVKVERRRRSLDVVATATTDAPPATRYRMVVQLGERRSKTLVTGTAREGRLELRLAFRGLLLPGDYTCVIEALKDDKSVGATVEKSFGFGSEAERKAAREGVRLWLERALDAVSGLALELEREAARHRTAMAAAEGKVKVLFKEQAGFDRFVTESLERRLRVARMDYGVYQRRLELSPFPTAGERLGDLFKLIPGRVKAHRADLRARTKPDGSPPGPPPVSELTAVTNAIADRIGLEPERRPSFELGDRAAPENGTLADGTYTSKSSGFAIAVPEGFRHRTDVPDPGVRFLMEPKDENPAQLRAIVILRSPIRSDLVAQTGIEGWESFNSYQQLSLAALDDGREGVTHTFGGEYRGVAKTNPLYFHELRLRRADGWILQLLVSCRFADRKDQSESIETITKSFKVLSK